VSDAGTPLVDVLALWQREARALLPAIAPVSHPEGVLPAQELAGRNRAVQHLRWTMMPRETRKQRFLWPAVRAHFRTDVERHDGTSFTAGGDEVIEELRTRKRNFEEVLIRLRWADDRSKHFEHRLDELINRIESYIGLEEQLLRRISAEIPAAEQDRIVARLLEHRALLPVQAHPDLPALPWMAAVLAPVAGVVDRLRDRLTTAPG